MAAIKHAKASTRRGRMVLPGPHKPMRRHYCWAHGTVLKAVKIWGKKAVQFQCDAGCKLSRGQTDLR